MKFRKITSAVIGTALAAVLFLSTPPAGFVAEAAGHSHPICGELCRHSPEHRPVEWTAVASLDEITGGGNYYLTEDVALEGSFTIDFTVNLCLNNHDITNSGTGPAFIVAGGSLTITDCWKSGRQGAWQGEGYEDSTYVIAPGTDSSLSGGVISGKGGGILVSDSGSFEMYAGNIAGCQSSGITVDNSAFTMFDGNIIGNKADKGAGVCVVNGGSFTMRSGQINSNKARTSGGGIYADSGKLELDGYIQLNTSEGSGGGIYRTGSSKFTRTGAFIIQNKAARGGGVYADGNASFSLSGARINGNEAAEKGGGVYTAGQADFSLSASQIMQNTAPDTGGGMYMGGRSFNVQDYIFIKENRTTGDSPYQNDLFLDNGKVVTLTGPLAEGSKIYIATNPRDGGHTVTSGWTTYMADANPDDFFEIDGRDALFYVSEHNNELIFHIHIMQYTAQGNTMTAVCTTSLNDYHSSFRLVENDEVEKIYTGRVIQGLKIEYDDNWTGERDHIIRYTNAIHPGTATGSITCGDRRASADFEILKAAGSVEIKAVDKVYDGLPVSPEIVARSTGRVTFRYKNTYDMGDYTETAPVNAGNYSVKVTVAADENYTECSAEQKFTIKKAPLIISVNDAEIFYGDSLPTPVLTYTGFVNGESEAVLIRQPDFLSGYEQFDPAGNNYSIFARNRQADNYNITYASGKLIVSPRPATVTINPAGSIYGDPAARLTAADDGIFDADKPTAYTLSTEVTGQTGVGAYHITGTVLNDNYSITFIGGEGAYRVTPRTVYLDLKPYDKQYDGQNHATLRVAELSGMVNNDRLYFTGGKAEFDTPDVGQNKTVRFSDYRLKGDKNVVKNYTLSYPETATASIYNTHYPEYDREYTYSPDPLPEWLTSDLTVEKLDVDSFKHTLSQNNTAAGPWADVIYGSTEGENSTLTFYVRTIRKINGEDRVTAISNPVTITYNLDKTAPEGRIYFDERNSWQELLNTISFNIFFKSEVTVKIEATDAASGVKIVEWREADKALTLDELSALTIWQEMPADGVGVSLREAKQFIYYAKITDNAGHITYLSTDGAEYDTAAPVITGPDANAIYYTTQKITAEDKNLDKVTVNGRPATGEILLPGNADIIYTVTAYDKAGNSASFTLTMKPISQISQPIDGLTADNVRESHRTAIERVIQNAERLLTEEHATRAEKAEINRIIARAKDLLAKLNSPAPAPAPAPAATPRPTPSPTPKPSQGTNSPAVDKVEKLIEKLPYGTGFKIDNEGHLKALAEAKAAYDALTSYQKRLVDKSAKDKLEALLKASADYKITKGDGSVYEKQSGKFLSFTANGRFSKFSEIEVDGRAVEREYYEANSGSTVVTLKNSFLDALSIGKHIFTVLYTDGEASAEFEVVDKPVTADPDPADTPANPLSPLLILPLAALIILLIILYKRRKKDEEQE